jgi:hypothetical protein
MLNPVEELSVANAAADCRLPFSNASFGNAANIIWGAGNLVSLSPRN